MDSCFLAPLFIAYPCLGLADEIKDEINEEVHYSRGMTAYQNKNYGVCADELYLVNVSRPHANDKARLFLSYCQYMLNKKSFAANHLSMVYEDKLDSKEEKQIYQFLQMKLKPELNALNPTSIWILPYYSNATYSASSVKNSFYSYGASAGISNQKWGLDLRAEDLSVTYKSALGSNYTQTQFGVGLHKMLGRQWLIRVDGTLLNATLDTYNAYVGGGGLEFTPILGSTLGVDYQFANYPNLSFGTLYTNQISGFLDQVLWSTPTTLLHLKLLGQANLTYAPNVTTLVDSATSLTLRPEYYRFAAMLELRTQGWVFNVQGWRGREAFEVRDQGAIIFNVYEEHHYGFSGKLGYQLASWFFLQAGYWFEDFLAYGVESTMSSYTGGFVLSF